MYLFYEDTYESYFLPLPFEQATFSPMIYLYQVSFGQFDFGRGDAGSFILTAIIVLFTLLQGRIFGFGRSDR